MSYMMCVRNEAVTQWSYRKECERVQSRFVSCARGLHEYAELDFFLEKVSDCISASFLRERS